MYANGESWGVFVIVQIDLLSIPLISMELIDPNWRFCNAGVRVKETQKTMGIMNREQQNKMFHHSLHKCDDGFFLALSLIAVCVGWQQIVLYYAVQSFVWQIDRW